MLLADAYHTQSDVLTSLAVIAALIGVKLGWPVLDPVAALVVAVFIGHAAYQIARSAADILADRACSTPARSGGSSRRSGGRRLPRDSDARVRGPAFLDLHVWFAPDRPRRKRAGCSARQRPLAGVLHGVRGHDRSHRAAARVRLRCRFATIQENEAGVIVHPVHHFPITPSSTTRRLSLSVGVSSPESRSRIRPAGSAIFSARISRVRG